MSDRHDFPYYKTRSDEIVVNDGWRRDCPCPMNPCDVPWHYARSWEAMRDAARWIPDGSVTGVSDRWHRS